MINVVIRVKYMRFIAVKKHFLKLEAINYFVSTSVIESKAKFSLEVSEKKVIIFSLIQVYGRPEFRLRMTGLMYSYV
jgi:hypothetical protein